jgi:C-terminal processing protease CtpA/Prc
VREEEMMNRSLSRAIPAALLTFSFACGGASEERVNALEAQIQQMKAATASGDVGPQIVATQEKVAAVESSTESRFKKMEQMLEVLQREVTRVANPTSERAKSTGADPWNDVDAVLGAEGDPVAADGDTYTVKRAWLLREVHALALAGKGPTFTEGKKGGVSVKGVKPREMLGRLGLKNNDVIRAIGDSEVNSPAEAAVALRASKSPVQVKVQRKKKELTLEYVLAD